MAAGRGAPPDRALVDAGYAIPFPTDPFETGSGPYYARHGDGGRLELAVRVERRHCNDHQVAHGGMLATFADLAVCLAAVDGVEGGRALTISLTSNFLAPAPEGALLEIRPVVTRRTGRMAFVSGAITNGDETVFTCTAVIRVVSMV